jgi:hypothetical protein
LSIRAGISGVLKVMRHLEMIPKSKSSTTIKPVVANSTSWVRAPISGMLSRRAGLGTSVTEGQTIAIVGDPLGDYEEKVFAPCDGIIIGRANLPLAHEGDALFNIAAFKSVARAEDKLEKFAATHGQ